MILSPVTGDLLEAQNLGGEFGLQNLYDSISSAVGANGNGGSMDAVAQWLDFTQPSTVVSTLPAAEPANLPGLATPIATFSAVTVPHVTLNQLKQFESRVMQLPGSPSTSGDESASQPGIYEETVTVHGSKSNVAEVGSMMRASGLFASITEHD